MDGSSWLPLMQGNEAKNKTGVKISPGSFPPAQLCVALASLQEEAAACDSKSLSFPDLHKILAAGLAPMLRQFQKVL